MHRDYVYAYRDLCKQYIAIKSNLEKLTDIQGLQPIKEIVKDFNLSGNSTDFKNIWDNIKNSENVCSQIKPILDQYIQEHEDGITKDTALFNVKLANLSIERYQEQLHPFLGDLLFATFYLEKEDDCKTITPILKKEYPDEASFLKDTAFKMCDMDFREEHSIPKEIAVKVFAGATDQLQLLGEDITDLILADSDF